MQALEVRSRHLEQARLRAMLPSQHLSFCAVAALVGSLLGYLALAGRFGQPLPEEW